MTKKFISAGVGSGKTYRITTDVAQMVKEGHLQPEQVIMTTFTKAAAKELREKTKQALADLKLHREAQQMEHALIGTVHSVANTFLTKYWYLLGIMPDAAAIEENELQLYRDHSLRGLLKDEERKFLFDYAEKYNVGYGFNEQKSGINYEFWKKDLIEVLDYTQWYNIDKEQLKKSVEVTESILTCLATPNCSLMQCAYGAIDEAMGAINNMKRPSPQAKDEMSRLSNYRTQKLTEDELADLASIAQKRSPNEPNSQRLVQNILANNMFTPENTKDQKEYAKLIFDLALRWRENYRKYKDEHHLIDFNDMEEMFLKLLGMSEVQQDIRSRYTHLFVDEFQDSNPIQVRIFQELAKLLNTVYVGDKKQAIYGFRGSDTELTTAVADSFDDKDKDHLEHSYRSVEPLVNFSNAIFSKVFSQMKEEEVTLSMPTDPKKGNRTSVDHPLRLWSYEKDKKLALQIQQLSLREKIDFKDIAILARKNSDLDTLADELRKLKVPVCRESTDIKESRTGRLMKALLTLVDKRYNDLARAEVSYLTQHDNPVSKIIEDRIDFLKSKGTESNTDEYLQDLPIIERLLQLLRFRSDKNEEFSHNLLSHQSISSLVESLVIELDLYALVQSWENAKAEEANLQTIIDLARKYEDSATKTAQPATIAGFVSFFTDQKQQGAANEEGVRLFTYHKSKGLEWRVVILLSLDNDGSNDANIVKNEMLGCHFHREQKPTAENMNPPMTISLVRNIYCVSKATKEPAAMAARLQEHKLWQPVCDNRIFEDARLLYVGVTRAKEILILASKEKGDSLNLNWFRSVGIKDMQQILNENDEQDIFCINMPFYIERLDEENLIECPEQAMENVHPEPQKGFSSLDKMLYLTPSKVEKTPHEIMVVNDLSQRIEVRINEEEEALMGDFIHQVFCCCDDDISVEQIVKLRDNYGFTAHNMPCPEKLLDSWKYLIDTLTQRYGPAVKHHHERPFRHFDAEGHIVCGYIDFIWETEDSYIVVDYKTCLGDYSLVFNPGNKHYVGLYGEQLDCYQRALEAEGSKKVAARIIYYPVTRYIAEVKL